jgi:FHS family L-fucose permease-like MFS transporter
MNRSFFTLVSVFFFWGFVAASNDILIPVFKNELHLEQWQSQLISFAFYIAYTVGSVIYYLISLSKKGDLLNRIGYKNGLMLGLLISASGTLLFIPAAQTASFPIMISGLFIVGLGFSLQQTVANPLAINLGDPKKGSQRLSFAGGINNIGTTIGPILVSLAIFGSVATSNVKADISNIQIPYLILGLAFILVAVIFKFSSIPNQIDHDAEQDKNDQPVLDSGPGKNQKAVFDDRGSALKYPQLLLGMAGIFVYVGVEVSTGGNLGGFLEQKMGIKTKEVAPFVSLFWASLMIGRWTSAAEVFSQDKNVKNILRFLLPYMAFGLYLFINSIVGNCVGNFYYYAGVIVVMIVAEWLSRGNPARQLLIFSGMGIVALLTGILSKDPMVSAYAFMSVGLFCSTLWPCVFTLSIAGLGKYTNQGSGFLIMMIMGGGFISLLQGYLAKDELLGIQSSYLVGVACFAYLAFFAMKAKHILLKQGIDYDQNSSSGH